MPPKPKGDKAMTGAERLRRFRERQRKLGPFLTDRQRLNQAQAEISRLRTELAAAAKNSNAPAVDPLLAATQQELAKARAEIAQLRAASRPVSDAELRKARQEAAQLRDEVAKLKAKITKPVKMSLDPKSEAARQIEALKKTNTALRQRADDLLRQARMLVPSEVRTKVAKALNEQTTNPARRLDALQAWNGLGLNKIGS